MLKSPHFKAVVSFLKTKMSVFSLLSNLSKLAFCAFCLFSLFARRDPQGNSAISYIVRATSHLLDPRAPEFTASFVGRLVTTMIKKVGDLTINLVNLIKIVPLLPYKHSTSRPFGFHGQFGVKMCVIFV